MTTSIAYEYDVSWGHAIWGIGQEYRHGMSSKRIENLREVLADFGWAPHVYHYDDLVG